MTPAQRKRKLEVMSILCLLGGLYSLADMHWSTGGHPWLVGFLGVALGLCIASFPSSTLVDILVYERFIVWKTSSKMEVAWWLIYNAMVFMVGALVLYAGLLQFTAAAG